MKLKLFLLLMLIFKEKTYRLYAKFNRKLKTKGKNSRFRQKQKLDLTGMGPICKPALYLSGYFCYNIPQLHSRKSNSFNHHKVFMDIGYILLQKSKSIGACNFSVFAELADSRKCFQMDWKSFFGKTQ